MTRLSSRDIGDPTQPRHLGYEELDLAVSLQSTTIDRADLDVVLVVLPELRDAGVAAVVRVRKRTACDSKEVFEHVENGTPH